MLLILEYLFWNLYIILDKEIMVVLIMWGEFVILVIINFRNDVRYFSVLRESVIGYDWNSNNMDSVCCK